MDVLANQNEVNDLFVRTNSSYQRYGTECVYDFRYIKIKAIEKNDELFR